MSCQVLYHQNLFICNILFNSSSDARCFFNAVFVLIGSERIYLEQSIAYTRVTSHVITELHQHYPCKLLRSLNCLYKR